VYAVGDIVLGKVRGYAPWPGMVSRLFFLLSFRLYAFRERWTRGETLRGARCSLGGERWPVHTQDPRR
jgi:hypothetical protein